MGDSSRSSTMYFEAVPQMEPINGIHAQLLNQDLLDKIDKLRDLGVHEFVALPQLVVVGDQSSGKSSVLEALMDVPFPRSDKLCTRFATNIIFRSSLKTSTTVSIIPGSSRSPEEKEKLRAFKREILAEFDGDTFESVLKEVRIQHTIGRCILTDFLGLSSYGCFCLKRDARFRKTHI